MVSQLKIMPIHELSTSGGSAFIEGEGIDGAETDRLGEAAVGSGSCATRGSSVGDSDGVEGSAVMAGVRLDSSSSAATVKAAWPSSRSCLYCAAAVCKDALS